MGQAGAGHALLEQTRGEEKRGGGEESGMGRDGSKKEGEVEEEGERKKERVKGAVRGRSDGCLLEMPMAARVGVAGWVSKQRIERSRSFS